MSDIETTEAAAAPKASRLPLVAVAAVVAALSGAGGWFASDMASAQGTAPQDAEEVNAEEPEKGGKDEKTVKDGKDTKEAKLEPILLDPLVLTLPRDRSCGGRVRIVAALMSSTYQGELKVPLTGALLEAAYEVDCSDMGSSGALPRMRSALTGAARKVLKDPGAEVLITEFVLL
jgi:hypothetical protein